MTLDSGESDLWHSESLYSQERGGQFCELFGENGVFPARIDFSKHETLSL
jgi:hypothetical protein